jgi:hypothetical protein
MNNKVDMRSREATIIRFIHECGPNGATVRKVWETLRKPEWLSDNITIQAYHRIMNKMVARGKLVNVDSTEGDSRRFGVSEYLTPENALSLTDIEEGLWTLSAPEALAKYLDALDYFEGRCEKVLKQAANGLLEEDPVELVVEMLMDKVDRLREALEDFHDLQTKGVDVEHEIHIRHAELVTLVHSYYGLSSIVFDLGSIDHVKTGEHLIDPNWDKIKEALRKRVFGEHALFFINANSTENPSLHATFTIGRSDGSTHAGFIRGIPGAEFIDDTGHLVLSFNNSIAALHLPDPIASEFEFPYHGVPMTRSALVDPSNKGMILARPWYSNLTDSEFEHMKKSALDVVQFRVDERIVLGTARALGTDRTRGSGRLLPRPYVHIRDGTVVPQEREFNHYTRFDEYGEMVREGITLSYNILRAVKDSKRLVFAGAVKSTQLKTFSTLLNWYIARGSARKFGRPLDPEWDISRAGHISDNHAMTRLMASLDSPGNGKYLCSFAVLRPFPQLVTTWYRAKISESDWITRFESIRDRHRTDQAKWGGLGHYLESVDIPEDPYLLMCQNADYLMFYIGHTGGDPSPVLPRYEFIDSLRGRPFNEMKERVSEKVNMIVKAIHTTGFSLDIEHNFMTNKRISRIEPAVVFDAHEKCKVWGHKLESELKSAIVERLAELKKIRGIASSSLNIVPMPIREYLLKMQKALINKDEMQTQQLPQSED